MLTVIAGGMFAEKSTELQRRGRRLKRAGKKVLYFKPDFDNRYSEDKIVTHDGEVVDALNLSVDAYRPLLNIDFMDTDVVLIDEVQFFGTDIHRDIEIVLSRYPKLQIIVAGLDLDYAGNPFFTTALLMATAEKVIKLNAVCVKCGADSWVSYKVANGKRIELGTDEYKPMCRSCYNKTF